MPDLGQRLVGGHWAQATQLLQGRLNRQIGIDQHVVDAARQVLFALFFAISLLDQGLVFDRVRIGGAQAHVGLQNAVAIFEVDRLHRIPLVKAGGEGRQVMKKQGRRALVFLETLLHAAGRNPSGLVRDRWVQGVKLVLHEELPVRMLHHPVANRYGFHLAHG